MVSSEYILCMLALWILRKYLLQNSLRQISQYASAFRTPILRSASLAMGGADGAEFDGGGGGGGCGG